MKVLIAGAGIGGLTLALMLHQRGIEVEIYESAREIREVGVGINILPHAIRELDTLGLLSALDKTGIRTKHLTYYTKDGSPVWSELRGIYAGNDVPQFSIHRGRLQNLIYDAVIERIGKNSIKTGAKLQGISQDEAGVTAYFANNVDGGAGLTARGDVLICCDGIHSAGRKFYYPNEASPSWNGVMMWRGAAEAAPWQDGLSMAIGGGLGGKFVLYPIAPEKAGKQLMNWVVNIRVKDPKTSPPPANNWSRKVSLATVLPHGLRFHIPEFDIENLIRQSPAIYEYPMADRDPLPRWTFGRVTLLGDAAHPMYPVGSNGASQAILDARKLADSLKICEHPRAALWDYEKDRLPKATEIVRTNRIGGPERVIDAVEKLAPAGFFDVDNVLSYHEREAIVRGYAKMAGYLKIKQEK